MIVFPPKEKRLLPSHVLQLLVNLELVFRHCVPGLCLGVLLAGRLIEIINSTAWLVSDDISNNNKCSRHVIYNVAR